MSRKTSAVSGGDTGLIGQYNTLRDEAQGSARLLAQGTNALRVFVNEGLVYFGGTTVEFTGSESAVMSDTAASSRIDAVSLQSSNVLLVTTGIEDDTPTAPDIPDDDIPICTVYIRKGGTKIDDTDGGGGDGYIDKDLRPMVANFGSPWEPLMRVELSATSTGLIDVSFDTNYDAFRVIFFVFGSISATSRVELFLNGVLATFNQQFIKASGATITAVRLTGAASGLRLIQGDVNNTKSGSGEVIIMKPTAGIRGTVTGTTKEGYDTGVNIVTYTADYENESSKISRIEILIQTGDGDFAIGSFASVEGMKL